jgi:hypothetical protein
MAAIQFPDTPAGRRGLAGNAKEAKGELKFSASLLTEPISD